MDKILREATQFLNEYKPKEALEKLSGLQKKSEQSLQLTENCKMLLRQQLLYLLKEANNSNDYKEMEVLLVDYESFLGKDEHYKFYISSCQKKKEEQSASMYVVFGVLMLLLVLILLLPFVY